ncbi:hypothetical protein SKAU_G00390010 [Synaphobranchus kaupii]|uniref:Uncharacterized protein n=1 Tax=Synaphobranchus kaupii TaxID=118154 RepID=A0A9Q1EBA3_SYNKA|nr:hypothetical protein SKAU_G00390010 [Synaphobranchus kaupii]
MNKPELNAHVRVPEMLCPASRSKRLGGGGTFWATRLARQNTPRDKPRFALEHLEHTEPPLPSADSPDTQTRGSLDNGGLLSDTAAALPLRASRGRDSLCHRLILVLGPEACLNPCLRCASSPRFRVYG